MSSRSLADLDPRFRPIAEKLIAECEAAGIPITVICTLRSLAEQQQAVNHGVSWTMHSKHLPQPPQGKSLAIDIAPTALLSQKNWAPGDPLWWVVAGTAQRLGLRSGADWADIGLPPVGHVRPSWDPGHSEMKL